MFCGYCGKELKDNVKFCPNCGHANPFYKEELVIGEESKEEEKEETKEETTPVTQGENKVELKEEEKEGVAPLVLGILSIYFSQIPFLGLILAIIGLTIDKTKKYKVLNIIGGVLSIIMMIILIIALVLIFVYIDYIVAYLEANGGL